MYANLVYTHKDCRQDVVCSSSALPELKNSEQPQRTRVCACVCVQGMRSYVGWRVGVHRSGCGKASLASRLSLQEGVGFSFKHSLIRLGTRT